MEFLATFEKLKEDVSVDGLFSLQHSDMHGRYLQSSREIPAGYELISEKAAFSINNELKQHLITELKLPVMSTSRMFVAAMYDFVDLDMRLDALSDSSAPLCAEELEMMTELQKQNPGLLKRYLMMVNNSFEVANGVSELTTGFSPANTTALYFRSSFFNHACNPNCDYKFDTVTGAITVTTKRDVSAGEQLTIGYALVTEEDEDEDEEEVAARSALQQQQLQQEVQLPMLSKGIKAKLFKARYGVECNCCDCYNAVVGAAVNSLS